MGAEKLKAADAPAQYSAQGYAPTGRLAQLADLARRADAGAAETSSGAGAGLQANMDAFARLQDIQRQRAANAAASGSGSGGGMDAPFITSQQPLDAGPLQLPVPIQVAPLDAGNAPWLFDTGGVFDAGGLFALAPAAGPGAASGSTPRAGTPARVTWLVPPRVLLVDDEPITRAVSARILNALGCTPEQAVDGYDAVEKMKARASHPGASGAAGAGAYDLVLMDIVMPRLDGCGAATLIRRFDTRTPIISVTGHKDPSQIGEYFQRGMNDFLPKPVTRDALMGMLEVRALAPLPWSWY
jgi:CheY-like chemotaxis protein